jgi:N-acyl-D-glutamate deacylase
MTDSTNETHDIVLANGRVIDPETYMDAQMHVGITGDRIVTVSETPLKGKGVIDVSGMIVAPGFIDMHAHGQDIAANRMQAFDGVTTALELEAGRLLQRLSTCHAPLLLTPASKPHAYTHSFARNPLLRWSGI